MTLGEELRGKMRKAKLIGFGFWLLFAAEFFLPHDGKYAFLLVIPFLGFASSALYILVFIKCPKCGFRLGQAMSGSSEINFCPCCGVDLDSSVKA